MRPAHRTPTSQEYSDRRPRVLRVIYGLEAGGTEVMLVRFLDEIRQREDSRFDFEVCTFVPGGRLERDLTSMGVRVFALDALGPWRLFRAPIVLSRLIRRRGYRIVHAHLFPAEVLVAWTSLFAHGPTYVLGKHNEWTRRIRPWHLWLERLTTSRYARILCNSTAVELAVRKRVPHTTGRTVVLHNGVPFTASAPVLEPAYDVIAVGNLRDRQKGIDILLRALALVSDDSINAIVVGDGPQRAELESLSRQLGLRDRVEFHGASCRVPDLLARSRVFALPSRYEGMPNALLEAMVSGLPVIAAAVGGVSEIVTDGETGLIIPPEDPKALAKAITRLLADEGLAGRLGRSARASVQCEFTIAAHTDRCLAIYEELLAS